MNYSGLVVVQYDSQVCKNMSQDGGSGLEIPFSFRIRWSHHEAIFSLGAIRPADAPGRDAAAGSGFCRSRARSSGPLAPSLSSWGEDEDRDHRTGWGRATFSTVTMICR